MSDPILIPWRPGVSTVSYAGPTAAQIAERLPRARAHHARDLAKAKAARIAGDSAGHARALQDAAWSRWIVVRLLVSRHALATIWHDRTWFYFDDPEYLRREALRPVRPMARHHPARSRGEDITYIERRLAARRAARRARRTPEHNAALDRARFERRQDYLESVSY